MGAETLKGLEMGFEVIDAKHETLDEGICHYLQVSHFSNLLDIYEKQLANLKTRSKNPLYI